MVCYIPQILRNFKYRCTFTQSLSTKIIAMFGGLFSMVVYFNLQLTQAFVSILVQLTLTGVLIAQIILWRHNKEGET
jgi:hypothetical protein